MVPVARPRVRRARRDPCRAVMPLLRLSREAEFPCGAAGRLAWAVRSHVLWLNRVRPYRRRFSTAVRRAKC